MKSIKIGNINITITDIEEKYLDTLKKQTKEGNIDITKDFKEVKRLLEARELYCQLYGPEFKEEEGLLSPLKFHYTMLVSYLEIFK